MSAPVLPSIAPLVPVFVRAYRWGQHWQVNSRSQPGQWHTVTITTDGDNHCSCKLHTLGGRRCAHLRAVEAAIREAEHGIQS